jgi:hypothetical protein
MFIMVNYRNINVLIYWNEHVRQMDDGKQSWRYNSFIETYFEFNCKWSAWLILYRRPLYINEVGSTFIYCNVNND